MNYLLEIRLLPRVYILNKQTFRKKFYQKILLKNLKLIFILQKLNGDKRRMESNT